MTIDTLPSNSHVPGDEPSVAPGTFSPGSFSVATQLMQDAIRARGVSVRADPWNQEALFANPFKDSREEALIINLEGHLTYLARHEETDTGWLQEPVSGVNGKTFAEVVVAVHPNGGVYAFAAPADDSDTSLVHVLMLTKTAEVNGLARCSWAVQPNAVGYLGKSAMLARNFRSACVSYSPDGGPTIAAAAGPAGGPYSLISASIPGPQTGHTRPWSWDAAEVAIGANQRLVGAGYLPYSGVNSKPRVYVLYFLNGQTLTRFTQVGIEIPEKVVSEVSTTVKQFCGTMNIPNFPRRLGNQASDVAAVYLDTNGDLVVSYLASSYTPAWTIQSRTSGLGFDSAKCWQDADGKAHVFGLDDSGTLRVLHQSAWKPVWDQARNIYAAEPAWTQAAVAGAPAGIGGYDLMNPADRLVAFDYAGSGCADHLVAYRPGTGTVRVLERTPLADTFDTVYESSAGLPGYDFGQATDMVVAFDYARVGSADHLVAYRPGAGKLSVFAAAAGAPGFKAVVTVPAGGIGDCLNDPADRLVPFDYTGSRHADHLLCYRPGTGKSWVLAVRADGSLAPVAAFTGGLGGFGLDRAADQVTGFDYNRTGSADHLLAYRPGAGMVFILAADGKGGFTAVVRNSTGGIGTYDLARPNDRLLPFDYTGLGRADHLLAYRPGDRTAWVLERTGTTTSYSPVVRSSDGLGGYDFGSAADTVTGYDYGSTRSLRYLVAYRPGSGKVSVMGQRGGVIAPVYQAPAGASLPVAVGLYAQVADFQLDPYPDYKPSELIKMSGTTPAEAYCICTQDVTTSSWQTDKVRLPEDNSAEPHIVSHYVANATLLSRQGGPMPGHDVSISADSLVEVQIGAVSYQVGPGRAIASSTDPAGKLVLSIAARGLKPPVVHLNADGLESGLAIDFAASVNDFLAGQGTLPSQAGLFTPSLLESAQTVPNTPGLAAQPLADWDELKKRGLTPAVVVDHCANMYAQAAGGGALRPAMINGFAEPQPIVGYVIQLWDPDRPAYQPFRSYEELAAYKHYRNAHPAYGGWWDDFTTWASDVWEGIKTGAARVAEVIVTTVTEIAVWIGQAVVSLGEFVIDAIEQAVQGVEAVFQMVADAITRVIDWLKSLFAFRDIWDTKDALQKGIGVALDYGDAAVEHARAQAHGWFEKQESAVTTLFEGLKSRYGNTRLGDIQNQAPSPKDPAGAAVDRHSLQHDPQANWMLDQVGVQSLKNPGLLSAWGLPPDSPLRDAINIFMRTLTDSGIGTVIGEAKDGILALLDPADPDGVESSGMIALLDLVKELALGLLKALDTLVQGMLDLARTVLSHADDLLNSAPTDLGFVETLYKWIQTSAYPEKKPEAMTFSGLLCLIAGFFVTTLYKLIMGVGNAPFPGGEFPAIPAPPWHPSYDPAEVTGGDPAENARLAGLQIACGAIGILAAASQAVSDVYDVMEADKFKKPAVTWSCAAVNLVGAAFAVIANCPPVTGTDWDAARGEFAGVFAVGTLQVCAQIAAMAANAAFPEQDPNLKNLLGNTGTVAVGVLNWTMLGLMADACIKTKLNTYTSLQNTFQFIPGSLAWIRIGGYGSPYYPPRAVVMAFLDTFGGVTTALMTIMGASLSLGGPTISSGSPPDQAGNWPVPDGLVGMAYRYELQVTGASQMFNTPAKNWQWSPKEGSSPVPEGLTIDSGVISGAPQQAGTYGSDQQRGFNVRCSDSFGPPQYSAPTPLAMKVFPTPIGAMAITSPTGNPQQDVYVSTAANPFGGNAAMTVTVTDKAGKALSGALVRFQFPVPAGNPVPTATFDADGNSAASVTTDQNGNATVPTFTTNTVLGAYQLTASIPGAISYDVAFRLQNLASNVASITPGSTSTPQSALPGDTFPYPVTATVRDAAGTPLPNVVGKFSSPSGPPAPGYFVSNHGTTVTAVSDANGNVNVGDFSAANDGYYGDFLITASIPGTQVTATYNLTVKRN